MAPVSRSDRDNAFTAFHRKSRFGSLDGLRALSVAAVIWHHTGGSMVAAEWAQHGHHGVTLFFAISGFLITALLLREHGRHGTIDLRAFYVRRALRIFALYYAVLLLYCVLVFAIERHNSNGRTFFSNLIYFATYTSNWFVALDGRTIFYFAWSLAAEEQFYLVWPPLMKRLGTPARALVLSVGVVAALAALEVLLPWLMPDSAVAQMTHRVVLNIPLAIIAGVVAALLLHDPALLRPPVALARPKPLAQPALARARGGVDGGPRLTALRWPCGAGAVCRVVLHARRPRAGLAAAAAVHGVPGLDQLWPVLLCKNVVLKLAALAGLTPGPGLLFLLTLLGAVLVAGLSFRCFETPFLRLKGRFERNSEPLPATGRA